MGAQAVFGELQLRIQLEIKLIDQILSSFHLAIHPEATWLKKKCD